MTRPAIAFAALATGVGLVMSCGSPTEPTTRLVFGTIDKSRSSAPVLVAAGQPRVGRAFSVTVNTVGSSSCTTAVGGEVMVTDDLARIVPYDRVPAPGHDTLCTDDFVIHPRDFLLVFHAIGPARVRVVGFTAASAASRLDSLEVQLTVEP
ncbi:MAG TPA: hypothetical protein VMY76_05885 [Gemmatimonadales bacterium]|nr:hypothetical protein [Gemmatimonadales bacterium]